jgi:2-aminoadipate transaminase
VLAMDESLEKHVSGHARWQRPDGGYFFWLELDESQDGRELRGRASDYKIGFQPGENFSATDSLKNYIRISFAHYSVNEIREAIPRLAALIKS